MAGRKRNDAGVHCSFEDDFLEEVFEGVEEEEEKPFDVPPELMEKFYGLVDGMTKPEVDTAIRFFRNTKIKDNGCLEWEHTREKTGYGKMLVYGLYWLTHRLSWSIFNGPIPEGMFICHKCDNPPCVHPDHLFLGTHQDNMRDAKIKRRQRRGETDELSPSQEHDIKHGRHWHDLKSVRVA